MNVQRKIFGVKLAYNGSTILMLIQMGSKHKEQTGVIQNRAEENSLLIAMVTGDMVSLSFMGRESFRELSENNGPLVFVHS